MLTIGDVGLETVTNIYFVSFGLAAKRFLVQRPRPTLGGLKPGVGQLLMTTLSIFSLCGQFVGTTLFGSVVMLVAGSHTFMGTRPRFPYFYG